MSHTSNFRWVTSDQLADDTPSSNYYWPTLIAEVFGVLMLLAVVVLIVHRIVTRQTTQQEEEHEIRVLRSEPRRKYSGYKVSDKSS